MSSITGDKFEKLVEIMSRLRAEDGCPWDREQTHQSLKKYLIEETYEAVDAIDSGDMDELRGELGDVLLQVLFHAQIASENGGFTIDDVVDGISTKLIHRHPHVFADGSAANADEVLHKWEQIKKKEKGFENRVSALDGVPRMLPALSRAMEISKKAAKTGFEWPNIDAVLDKVDEELHELKQELHDRNEERISDEIGDLLFTIVNVARWKNIDPEDALRTMIDRFSARFTLIEDAARKSGKSINELSIGEMDAIWNDAKKNS